jgi:hypothetical protein
MDARISQVTGVELRRWPVRCRRRPSNSTVDIKIGEPRAAIWWKGLGWSQYCQSVARLCTSPFSFSSNEEMVILASGLRSQMKSALAGQMLQYSPRSKLQ